MKKKFLIIFALVFLSAGCNPFKTSLPAGAIKSVNGGADWKFINALKGGANDALTSLSVSKLAFHPQHNQTVLLGSYTDGVFKSEDSGVGWSKILSKISVYDFAIDPLDSKVIYTAGFYADHGRVLKTVDGGASWNQVYNEESLSNPVRAIALNPENPNQVVIGTTSGSVITSSDAGNTWKLTKDFGDRINRIFWQNGNVYILLKSKGMFKSEGFSGSFTEITTSLNKSVSFAGLSYTSAIAVTSFNQAYVDVVAPSLIYLTTDKGLYKTTDGGKAWALQDLPIKPDRAEARAIAISKTSSNIVYTSVGSTIYKSSDGGSSWQTHGINSGGFINYILVDPNLSQIVYAGIYSTQ